MGRDRSRLLERRAVPERTPADEPIDLRPLTVKQAARASGLHEQTIRRAVERGEIEGTRVGGKVLILRRPFCEKFGLPLDYDFGPA